MLPVIKIEDRPIEGGSNARHSLLPPRIRIWKDAEHFHAVLAQERYEWSYLRFWGFVVMLPVLATMLLIPWRIALIMTPLLVLALYVPRIYKPSHRLMELRGKMIETIVAAVRYGADFEEKLLSEATTLLFYEQFDGWSLSKIVSAMRAERTYCERWVARHFP